ncbi:unnamed protein product [Linum trigynum]|uniref:Uncharacterized protein n=1 Tax=Linum trigynum TaxID=586398 RepID=A0AAV2CVV5_9ROSI
MNRGFKEELKKLMIIRSRDGCRKGDGVEDFAAVATVLLRVFVKGRYLGGVEEVMKIVEEGRICCRVFHKVKPVAVLALFCLQW